MGTSSRARAATSIPSLSTPTGMIVDPVVPSACFAPGYPGSSTQTFELRRGQRQGTDDQSHLRPVDDEHLTGIAVNGARGAQVLDDRFTQRPVAGRVTVCQQIGRCSCMAPDEACKELVGKLVERGGVDRERPGFARTIGLAGGCRLRDRCQLCVERRPARADRPADLVGDVVADECARTNLSVEITFLQQLIKGTEHRVPRDVQLFGQRACGRQALTRGQPPRRDRRTDSLVDLQIEGHGRRSIERNDRDHSETRGSTHESPVGAALPSCRCHP